MSPAKRVAWGEGAAPEHSRRKADTYGTGVSEPCVGISDMVTPAGFEPGIAAVKGRCPIRLDESAIGVPTRAQQGGSRGEKEEGGCGYALQEQKRRQQKWAEVAGAAWDNHENLVFTTETGRYINNKTLWANFKRIIQSIGMSKLRFHDLRHPYVKRKTKKFANPFETGTELFSQHPVLSLGAA